MEIRNWSFCQHDDGTSTIYISLLNEGGRFDEIIKGIKGIKLKREFEEYNKVPLSSGEVGYFVDKSYIDNNNKIKIEYVEDDFHLIFGDFVLKVINYKEKYGRKKVKNLTLIISNIIESTILDIIPNKYMDTFVVKGISRINQKN